MAALRDVVDRHRLWPFTLPYTIEFILRGIAEQRALRAGNPTTVPKDRPDSALTSHGSVIKTAGPFRRNLEAILDLAAGRGEPVVIATFAAYFAPGYSAAAFRARGLDYATHQWATELWGIPAHAEAGIAAHNAALLALHAARPTVGFADVAAAIPHERRYFNDVCHLTIAGSELMADALLPAALQALAPRFGPADTTAVRVP